MTNEQQPATPEQSEKDIPLGMEPIIPESYGAHQLPLCRDALINAKSLIFGHDSVADVCREQIDEALTALGRVEMVLDRDTIETRIIKSLTVQGIKEPYGFSVSDIVTDITGVIRGNPTPPGDAGERNTVTPMEK